MTAGSTSQHRVCKNCGRRTLQRTDWHTMSEWRVRAEANERHDYCEPCHELREIRRANWAAMSPDHKNLAEAACESGESGIARTPGECIVCHVIIAKDDLQQYYFDEDRQKYIRLCMKCFEFSDE